MKIDEVLEVRARQLQITPEEFKRLFEEDIGFSIEDYIYNYICKETKRFVEETERGSRNKSDVDRKVDKILIEKYFNTLQGRDKEIIKLRFGIENGIERTPEEVGSMLGLSKEYVVRTETKIIDKMKERFLKK